MGAAHLVYAATASRDQIFCILIQFDVRAVDVLNAFAERLSNFKIPNRAIRHADAWKSGEFGNSPQSPRVIFQGFGKADPNHPVQHRLGSDQHCFSVRLREKRMSANLSRLGIHHSKDDAFILGEIFLRIHMLCRDDIRSVDMAGNDIPAIPIPRQATLDWVSQDREDGAIRNHLI
jgi:hypothetical protein